MSENNLTTRVSEHIKQFRNNTKTGKKMSQESAAEALGVSLATLKRYENGETIPSEKRASEMEKCTGIIYPYWMGETECKTWKEFWEEDERRRFAGMEEHEKMIEADREQKRILFSRCGYQYKYLEGAPYDFASLLPDTDKDKESLLYKACHPHELTDFNIPDKHYYFDQSELEALISNLQDVIAFACFKKEKKGI